MCIIYIYINCLDLKKQKLCKPAVFFGGPDIFTKQPLNFKMADAAMKLAELETLNNFWAEMQLPETRSATEVRLLNCDPASLERWRSLIAHWLQMRVLRLKPQKVANKPTPQKDTSDIPVVLRLSTT